MINKKLYERLIEVAKSEKYISYEEVADILNINLGNPDDRYNILRTTLDDINRYEHEAKRPMLTAVVVHKNTPRICGDGFFELAKELKIMGAEQEKEVFFREELKRVYNYWNKS